MLFYMLPANYMKLLGLKINLTDKLKFTELENEGIQECDIGTKDVFCSQSKYSWNLKHVSKKVQVVPYFERKIGRTSTFSTFIG